MVSKLTVLRTVVLCWILVVGAGFAALMNYQNVKGNAGSVPRDWPADTSLSLDSRRDTLIMFAHPKCPCTRASVEELNRLLARSAGKIAAQVCFFQPAQFPDVWNDSDLRKRAAAIPGVKVSDDLEGAQARLFGAETSGYVLLYNPDGRLLFKGGITSSRGHAGDNAGEEAIIALASGGAPGQRQTPVYGCSLLDQRAANEAFPNKF